MTLMENKEVSFLLGAGFSKPAGYPSRTELNERLSRISQDEIYISTGGEAWFLDKNQEEDNEYITYPERVFVEDFIRFYKPN